MVNGWEIHLVIEHTEAKEIGIICKVYTLLALQYFFNT